MASHGGEDERQGERALLEDFLELSSVDIRKKTCTWNFPGNNVSMIGIIQEHSNYRNMARERHKDEAERWRKQKPSWKGIFPRETSVKEHTDTTEKKKLHEGEDDMLCCWIPIRVREEGAGNRCGVGEVTWC
jgi:hypothetical protein